MEATPDAEVEINSSDKGKKRRNWLDAFNTFMACGGIIVMLLLAAVLLIVIGVLTK